MKQYKIFFIAIIILVGLIGIINGAQFADAAFYSSLTVGSRGQQVQELQQALTKLRFYSGPVTGYFGPLTRAGVIKFQKAYNIFPQVGYFGNLTRGKLNQLLSQTTFSEKPVTFRGGQATVAGSKQAASIGTVDKKKRVATRSEILDFLLPLAHAQESTLTRLVAYISSQIPGFFLNGQISTYDFSTGQKIQLTSGASVRSKPAIAERTNKVAFFSDDNGPSQASPNGIKVEIVDLQTNTSKVVDEGTTDYSGLQFSHDGNKLAYYINAGQTLVIYDVNSQSKTTPPLPTLPGEYKFFSVDDSKIYFTNGSANILYELNLSTNQSREMFRIQDGSLDLISLPSASDNGVEIYYLRIKRQMYTAQPGEEGGTGAREVGYDFVRLNSSGQEISRVALDERGFGNYLITSERGKMYYAAGGKLLEIDIASGSKKVLVSSPTMDAVIGFGTSKDDLVLMRLGSFPLIEFYNYNLSSGVVNKIFDNSAQQIIVPPPPPPPVVQSVRVLTPNGSETLRIGTNYSITWNSQGLPSGATVNLYLLEGGTRIRSIATNVSASAGNYNWLVPSMEAATNLRIELRTSLEGIGDTSDSDFSILPLLSVRLTAPNGGETLRMGSNYNITWSASGFPVGATVTLYLKEGGSTIRTIASGLLVTQGIYTWAVPTMEAATNLRIELRTSLEGEGDLSDADFSILQPLSIKLTAPNGGETLRMGNTFSIVWSAQGFPSGTTASLYLLEGGSIIQTIATNLPVTSSIYSWTVPTIEAATNLKVELRTSLEGEGDTSDADFSVLRP